jgi:hypothetical protein
MPKDTITPAIGNKIQADSRSSQAASPDSIEQERRQTVVAEDHGIEQRHQHGVAPERAIARHASGQLGHIGPRGIGRAGFRQNPGCERQQQAGQRQ